MGVDGLTFSQLISHDFSKAAPSPTGAKYDLFQFYYQQHKQNDTNQDNVVAPLKSIPFHFNLSHEMTVMKIGHILNGFFYFALFSVHVSVCLLVFFCFFLLSNIFSGSQPAYYIHWV